MKDFYSLLKNYKESQGLSYAQLSEVIGKTPDAFRQAVKRESLSELEKEKFSELFGNPFNEQHKNPASLTAEDLIAEKVKEKMEPVIAELKKDLLEKIFALDLEVTQLREKLGVPEDVEDVES